jgi:hypothetical protein
LAITQASIRITPARPITMNFVIAFAFFRRWRFIIRWLFAAGQCHRPYSANQNRLV